MFFEKILRIKKGGYFLLAIIGRLVSTKPAMLKIHRTLPDRQQAVKRTTADHQVLRMSARATDCSRQTCSPPHVMDRQSIDRPVLDKQFFRLAIT
jgi:hypothetical protein